MIFKSYGKSIFSSYKELPNFLSRRLYHFAFLLAARVSVAPHSHQHLVLLVFLIWAFFFFRVCDDISLLNFHSPGGIECELFFMALSAINIFSLNISIKNINLFLY